MFSDNLQFYPTPLTLAVRAWKLFKNKNFTRVLEPHGGEGHLVTSTTIQKHPYNKDETQVIVTQMHNVADKVEVDGRFYSRRDLQIDCLEIDVTKHHILREKGMQVVGLDFMQFKQGAIYSHIIMNPPFASGVQHLLHAWDIMYDGEIVAIINAESIKNAFSKERKFLVDLIDQHGSVEFIQEAFVEAERTTEVEIALVYLRKESSVQQDVFGDVLDRLKKDKMSGDELMEDYQEINAVVLPRSLVETQVAAFNAALIVAKEAIFANQRAAYYRNVIGKPMEVFDTDGGLDKPEALKSISSSIYDSYTDLKNRAWTSILRSTEVTSRLSSQAQKKLESEFEVIKLLEFNMTNIYGFLAGLTEKRGEIQMGMACDVFDIISKYHQDNTVFHMGWKSNSHHRTFGMSIKKTRFILPNNDCHRDSLHWDALQRLGDIDKVFAMLDGKFEPEISLVSVFDKNFTALKNGERVSGSYFDVRYYPGIKTIHFFARDKKLVDRLNRVVGRQRAWLPPEGETVNEAFWLQYDNSEKFDKELRAELKTKARYHWENPLQGLNSNDEFENMKVSKRLTDSIEAVLERNGISINAVIEKKEALLLEAA